MPTTRTKLLAGASAGLAVLGAVVFLAVSLSAGPSGSTPPASLMEHPATGPSAKPYALDFHSCPETNPMRAVNTYTVLMDADGVVIDWAPSVLPYKKQSLTVLNNFKAALPAEEIAEIMEAMPNITKAFGKHWVEVEQIAAALGVDTSDVVISNIVYELSGGCTSIVANGPGDSIIHGRNLDYETFSTPGDLDGGADSLQIRLDFAYEATGEVAFTCATYSGQLGCLTGMRRGAFSISLNKRYLDSFSLDVVRENWRAAFPGGGWAYSLFIRELLTTGTNYSAALESVKTQKFANTAYLTLGGVHRDEGAVVFCARTPNVSVAHTIGAPDVEPLGAYPCLKEYCLVTNQDTLELALHPAYPGPPQLEHWGRICFFRIRGGQFNVQQLIDTGTLSVATMMSDVMTQCPSQVANANAPTILTAVMSAKTGYFDMMVPTLEYAYA